MPDCSVRPQNVKQSSPQKKFGMGYVKMHGFDGNILYDSRDWGVGIHIQSYRVSTYPRALKLVSN